MYYRLDVYYYSVGLREHLCRKKNIYVTNKKDLFAYIGYEYSTSFYPIERIDYELIKPDEDAFNATKFLIKYEYE